MIPKYLLKDPSGFESQPHDHAIAQERVLAVITKHYQLAGFSPINTTEVEHPDVLFAKAGGEITKQTYGLRLMNPSPDSEDDTKNLALRFDLTVGLARFVASRPVLYPFRRSQVGLVFRGERPKKGRYRGFIQADIDTVGDGELSLHHDAECVAVIIRIFDELKVGKFRVHLSNRKV